MKIKKRIDLETVNNMESGLSDLQRQTRLTILNAMINAKGAIMLESLEKDQQIIALELAKKGKVVIEDGCIQYAYPISGPSTIHQIKLSDGREFSSMCAIDSLGSTFTFHLDTVINSRCAQSGDPIYIKIENGKIIAAKPDTIHAIHVNLEENIEWASCC